MNTHDFHHAQVNNSSLKRLIVFEIFYKYSYLCLIYHSSGNKKGCHFRQPLYLVDLDKIEL